MGSLVGGWDSSMSDPTTVKLQRNKSMTNERIEAFWRLKKKAEKEHLEAMVHKNISTSTTTAPELVVMPEEGEEEMVMVLQRSASLPAGETILKGDHQVLSKSGWWRRSNSAFLNQPPILQQ